MSILCLCPFHPLFPPLPSLSQISSGTTEEKRTTVPFIYNLDEKVNGIDVVDFPGVDDRDESISELADLILTLAQIIVFVVDYRYMRIVVLYYYGASSKEI